MLTIVLGLALKAFKTQVMSEAVYVVIGFKSKLLSAVNMLQILFNTDMLVKCKSELGLWDSMPKGKFAKEALEYSGVAGGPQSQLVKVEGGRGSLYQ